MSEDNNIRDKETQSHLEQREGEHVSTSIALDDEQRVKVLSPSALVAKRFFRNKLAMAGLIILVAMFLFSFVGGIVSPYGEKQVFRKKDETIKDYAMMSENKDFLYTNAEGKEFPSAAGAKMILAVVKEEPTFQAMDVTYTLVKVDQNLYEIYIGEGDVSALERVALASKMVFSMGAETTLTYDFKLNAEKAYHENSGSFIVDGVTYEMQIEEGMGVISQNGEEYATISSYAVRPIASQALPLHFIRQVQEAVLEEKETLEYKKDDSSIISYKIEEKGNEYRIRSEIMTVLIDDFASPTQKHLLGKDKNGMDVLTRLMYGGRISLMIGFVAIAIEILIGVIVGGLAGYFGKRFDTILMRFVDIIICIPAMPIYIITGAIMDYYQIDPRIRIYLLCAILGLLSWPPIARMVRGQILSLREQEFMVAAEATGIRVSKRIFKHLIPNVIPNLIVIATMGLGEIIIMEATLSFLGIGVKFPYASWGNIINSVNDIFVMTNYWFVWIPAGFLILITVLGFNFVGDGLRDAFDPKMKR